MELRKAREIDMDALELKKKSKVSKFGQKQKAARSKPLRTSHRTAPFFTFQASGTQAHPINIFFAIISEKLANVTASMMPCITLQGLSHGITASPKRSRNQSLKFSAHSQGLSASSSSSDSLGALPSKKLATVLVFPKAGHPRFSQKSLQT